MQRKNFTGCCICMTMHVANKKSSNMGSCNCVQLFIIICIKMLCCRKCCRKCNDTLPPSAWFQSHNFCKHILGKSKFIHCFCAHQHSEYPLLMHLNACHVPFSSIIYCWIVRLFNNCMFFTCCGWCLLLCYIFVVLLHGVAVLTVKQMCLWLGISKNIIDFTVTDWDLCAPPACD